MVNLVGFLAQTFQLIIKHNPCCTRLGSPTAHLWCRPFGVGNRLLFAIIGS